MDLRTAYQHCHELQYNQFGSVQGLMSTMSSKHTDKNHWSKKEVLRFILDFSKPLWKGELADLVPTV